MRNPKLVIGLQVYNEEHKFLQEWVESVNSYSDALVVVDDCSTDRSVEILREGFKGDHLQIEVLTQNLFRVNELEIRKKLWESLKLMCSTLAREGSSPWILMLDADEFMEEKFIREFRDLLGTATVDHFLLRFHHFWRSRDYYRVDKLWKPPYGPRLIKFDPTWMSSPDKWRETPLHCGSTPLNIFTGKRGQKVDYVIKHYGYVLDPEAKHKIYTELDPDAKYCPKSHYDSIIDTDVVLEKWEER